MDTNSWGSLIAIAVLFFALGFLVGLAMRPDPEPTKGGSASTTDTLIAPAFSVLCDDLHPGEIFIRPVPVPVPDRENHAPRDPKTGRYMKRSDCRIDAGEPMGPITEGQGEDI